MRAAVAAGAVGMPLAVLAARWCLRHLGTQGIERRLEALCAQVAAWQAAHDHQVESMDRRLRDVEASAARAENEARMVSVQIAGMDRSLVTRLDRVQHRLARGASWRAAGGGCACAGPAHRAPVAGRASASRMAAGAGEAGTWLAGVGIGAGVGVGTGTGVGAEARL
jgi:hypothetical protein